MKLTGLTALGICFAALLPATPITYSVTVNTSSLIGTPGSLDLNFNPGPLTTQAATLAIQSFGGDGITEASPQTTGDVTGALPASLNFDNGTAFNDYFQDFTYGSTLTFDVSLSGPALSAPDGVSTSGSTFAFSMFSDSAGTIPALTGDTTDGFAFLLFVNLDGSTTVTNYSTETSISAIGTTTPPMIAPEPSTFALVGAVGFLASVARRRLATL